MVMGKGVRRFKVFTKYGHAIKPVQLCLLKKHFKEFKVEDLLLADDGDFFKFRQAVQTFQGRDSLTRILKQNKANSLNFLECGESCFL